MIIPYFAIFYSCHLVISTRHELLAMPGTFLESNLLGVNIFIQPPLSILPAFPGSRGSYLLPASYEWTVPGRTRSVRLTKVHPLTNIKTEGFEEIAKTHPRKGFFVRDEFKEKGIIGMLPGISKDMKYSTYGLTWDQVKHFANAFLEIAEKYNLI